MISFFQTYPYLLFSGCLFTIGLVGVFLQRKNIIVTLMSIELILLAVNTNFIGYSAYMGDIMGQIFVFFILTVAAAEAAIGLSIVVLIYRNFKTIDIDKINKLKG